MLGLGEVGIIWSEFVFWVVCFRFSLCLGVVGCFLGFGRLGVFYLWEGFCRGGNVLVIYWCFWRNKDFGRCKCEIEVVCICMCVYICLRVYICDCVYKGCV